MEKNKHHWFLSFLDLVINLAFIVMLALFIRTYIVSPFRVNGPSMCNTLNVIDEVCQRPGSEKEEKIIVNELIYQSILGYSFGEPKSGEVIVFRPPGNSVEKEYYVKRIIGIGGDTIKIVNGKVYKLFNDEFIELDESSYLNTDNLNSTYVPGANEDEETIYQVPDGHYFVMGDNRGSSADSRSCFSNFNKDCTPSDLNAYVTKSSIRGKAELVFWPFKNIRILDEVDYGI
jgi:signal peptidase I